MTSNTSDISAWRFRPEAPESLLDGLLHYYPALLEPQQAAILYQLLLQEIPWQQGRVVIYGREHIIPRLQAWHGDPGICYTYSGKTLHADPWTPTLQIICQQLNQLTGLQLNAVLCNLYRDGQDCMGWHADDERELGENPRILSLSLGAERDFALRRKGSSRQSGLLSLASGSLLDMQPGMQHQWQHSLPKRARVLQPRINLTFRTIYPL